MWRWSPRRNRSRQWVRRRWEQLLGHSKQTPNRQVSATALGRKAPGQKPQPAQACRPWLWWWTSGMAGWASPGAERKPHPRETTWKEVTWETPLMDDKSQQSLLQAQHCWGHEGMCLFLLLSEAVPGHCAVSWTKFCYRENRFWWRIFVYEQRELGDKKVTVSCCCCDSPRNAAWEVGI